MQYSKNEVFIIGCGGTGSRFVENLLSEPELWKESCTFYLVDPDKVEEKNLERQYFEVSDIDNYKSLVLAEKLLSCGIEAYPVIDIEYVRHVKSADYVFLFLDSIESRRYYRNLLFERTARVWFDSGNRLTDGQVFCLTKGKSSPFHRLYEAYLEKEDELPTCAEMPEQSVFINKVMARASYLLLKEVLFKNKDCHGLLKILPEEDSRVAVEVKLEEMFAINGYILNRKIMSPSEEVSLFWKLATAEGIEVFCNLNDGTGEAVVLYNVDGSGSFNVHRFSVPLYFEEGNFFYRLVKPSGSNYLSTLGNKRNIHEVLKKANKKDVRIPLAFYDSRYIKERIFLYVFSQFIKIASAE